MCRPDTSSGLSSWEHMVSLAPGSRRVQVGIEMSKAAQVSPCSLGKAVQGAQCPLPAEGPHRWAPGLPGACSGKGCGPWAPHRAGFASSRDGSLAFQRQEVKKQRLQNLTLRFLKI